MVPGDYYVVRVRPTGWLLRPRVLSSVSPASCHRSSFHDALPSVFVLSYGSIDADVRIYEVCVQFTCTHTHAYIGKGHNPHERSRLHTRACRHPHSLVTMERWDEGGGRRILFEQKAPKQNAIMISPKDGWSKLLQIRVPASRMTIQCVQKCLLSLHVERAVKLVLPIGN